MLKNQTKVTDVAGQSVVKQPDYGWVLLLGRQHGILWWHDVHFLLDASL